MLKAIRILTAVVLALLLVTPTSVVAEEVYFYRKTDTADGGYILSGTTAWVGETPGDAYFSRFDADGQEIWHISLGGSNIDDGLQAADAVGEGTVILMSTNSSDGDMEDNVPLEEYGLTYANIVYKLDRSGEILWKHPIRKMDRYATNVINAGDGYLVIGQTYDDAPWVSFVDDDGNERWQTEYSDLKSGMFYNTFALKNGDILHVGRFFTPIPDSNFHTGEGWIVRTDNMGILKWSKRCAESDYDAIEGMVELDDGSLLLSGTTASSVDLLDYEIISIPWVLKTTASGALLWSKALTECNTVGNVYIQQVEDAFELSMLQGGYQALNASIVRIDGEGNLLK